jgi:hypothetical protein
VVGKCLFLCTLYFLLGLAAMPTLTLVAYAIPPSEPIQIIFEKPYVDGDSRKSGALWNEFFHSEKGILRPNSAYRISFDYKVLERAGDASFYSLARSANQPDTDRGWQEWTKDKGASGSVQMSVTTHWVDGFYLIIGIKNKGAIRIENLKIETDPSNTPLKLSSTAPKRTWKSSGRTAYFVDSEGGNDGNDGLSADRPWQSLAKVNSGEFASGDKIMLKAGSSWQGLLSPGGSGSKDAPIIVSKYGEGERPRIAGDEKCMAAVLLENSEFIELENLEVTNNGTVHQPGLAGVRIGEKDFGVVHHIVLRNLYVHDVTGSTSKSGGGSGINCQIDGKNTRTRFDDLVIEHCHLVKTDRDGITMFGNCDRENWFPSLHVVIRDNLLENIGGDGIVPEGCDGAIVEHNVLKGGRMRAEDYAAGIWPWSCDNTLVQYNVVSGMKGTKDGEAYDSDWNCRGSIFQYNFSHDNDGGFMLICDLGTLHLPKNVGNIGTVFRYNVSVNDGCHCFNISGPSQHTLIYNNVIYQGKGRHVTAVDIGNWGDAWPEDVRFINNIFCADENASIKFSLKSIKSVVFDNNNFAGAIENRPGDARAITADPMLAAPGGMLPANYSLRRGSPCVGSGKSVSKEPITDFAGVAVPAANPCLGAFQ